MLEKEIKILDIDTKNIIKKLKKLGAQKTFEGYIHDIYYDFHDEEKDELKMDANKRLFRVRQKGGVHMYTIKRKRTKKSEGGIKGLKVADEGEREITDVDSFKKVLEKYGMKEIREKKKYRISYSIGEVEFDIDDYYKGDKKNIIPPLLEIEAHNNKIIKEFVKKLDLECNKSVKWGSRRLFRYYGVDYSWL